MDFIITHFELLFYYIPMTAMMLVYSVRTMDQISNDLIDRSKPGYVPSLAIGTVIRRIVIAVMPLGNIVALILTIIRSDLVKDGATEVLVRLFDFIDSPVVPAHDKMHVGVPTEGAKPSFAGGVHTTSAKTFKVKGLGEIAAVAIYEGVADSDFAEIKAIAPMSGWGEISAEMHAKLDELSKLLTGRTLSAWNALSMQFNLAMVKRVLNGEAAEPPRKPRAPKVAPVTTVGGNDNNAVEEL